MDWLFPAMAAAALVLALVVFARVATIEERLERLLHFGAIETRLTAADATHEALRREIADVRAAVGKVTAKRRWTPLFWRDESLPYPDGGGDAPPWRNEPFDSDQPTTDRPAALEAEIAPTPSVVVVVAHRPDFPSEEFGLFVRTAFDNLSAAFDFASVEVHEGNDDATSDEVTCDDSIEVADVLRVVQYTEDVWREVA